MTQSLLNIAQYLFGQALIINGINVHRSPGKADFHIPDPATGGL
jgi:hypothetical protein